MKNELVIKVNIVAAMLLFCCLFVQWMEYLLEKDTACFVPYEYTCFVVLFAIISFDESWFSIFTINRFQFWYFTSIKIVHLLIHRTNYQDLWFQAMAKIFQQFLTEVFHYQNKRKSMNDLIIMFKINQTQCHVWMIGCSLHVLFSEKTLFSNCIIQPIIIFSYHHRLLLVIRNKIRFMMHIWQQTINYNYLVLQGFPFCII